MQSVPSPATPREVEFSPVGLILNVVAGGFVLLAAIGTGVLWFIVAALSTGRTHGIHPDVISAGYIALGVFVVAFGLVGIGFYFARGSRSSTFVSVGCAIGAIGVLAIPVVAMYGSYRGALERDVAAQRARLRVNDLSAIGRPCTLQPGSLQGGCPTGYTCTNGPFAGPQTPDLRCQILCFGTDDYCGAGSRCVGGQCVVGP